MKRLRINPAQCTGCESCVLACGFEHHKQFGLQLGCIEIDRDEEFAKFSPQVCIQCDERFCVHACPVGALSVSDETGAIQISEETCIGCRACEKACPHGGVRFSEGAQVPRICDLCGGDPQCVQVCRLPQAITFTNTEASGD